VRVNGLAAEHNSLPDPDWGSIDPDSRTLTMTPPYNPKIAINQSQVQSYCPDLQHDMSI